MANHTDFSTAELAAREFARQLPIRAAALAAELGRPSQSADLSEAEQLRRWQERSENGAAFAEQVVARIPPDPSLIAQHPKRDRIMELLQGGQVPEALTIAEYPLREDLATSGQTDFEGIKAYSERMAGRVQREAEKAAPTDGLSSLLMMNGGGGTGDSSYSPSDLPKAPWAKGLLDGTKP